MICKHILAIWKFCKEHAWSTLPQEYRDSPFFNVDADLVMDDQEALTDSIMGVDDRSNDKGVVELVDGDEEGVVSEGLVDVVGGDEEVIGSEGFVELVDGDEEGVGSE